MRVDVQSVTHPVGIVRLVAAILGCLAFALVASVGHEPSSSSSSSSSYWAWCMFIWCFCCFFTFLILVLELTTLSARVPVSWEDFTTAFAMLATLMCLAASVIYPTFFTCSTCYRQIGATVASWFCLCAYAGEVALTRLRPRGQTSGFLSTARGPMKILETFIACIIFTSLDTCHFSESPGLQWCVVAYSVCFIFALLVLLLTIGRVVLYLPVFFDKVVTVYNLVAAMAYLTAVVVWPLYSFQDNARPGHCGNHYSRDKLMVVTFMSICNFIVYTLDGVYSVWMVFCPRDPT